MNPSILLPDSEFERRFWERFIRSTVVLPNLELPCLEWSGARQKKGYGSVRFAGRNFRTHRLAWAVTHRLWPDRLVCHQCDNPPCGEPTHLFLGTYKENHDDSRRKNRHSPPPHPIGQQHPNAKLTDSDVVTIRLLHVEGAKQVEIASRFGLSQNEISSITTGKSWASVGGPLVKHDIERYDLDGSEASIKALASKYRLPYTTLRKRLDRGWDMSRAVTQPIKKDHRRCTSQS